MNLNTLEFRPTVVNLADDSTTINSSGQEVLREIHVNTVFSAHNLLIYNGTTLIRTILAAAGVVGAKFTFGDIVCTSLIIDPNDAATGSITVISANAP